MKPTASNIIRLEGVEYPLLSNIDALCLFEDISGKDYTSVRLTSIRDTALLMYCMAKAGAERTRQVFPYTWEEFRRLVDMEQLKEWSEANTAAVTEEKGEEKKAADIARGHGCGHGRMRALLP